MVGVAWAVSRLDFPLRRLAPVIARRGRAQRRRGDRPVARRAARAPAFSLLALMLDVALLTGLARADRRTVQSVQRDLRRPGGARGADARALCAPRCSAACAAAGFGLLIYWHLRELDPGAPPAERLPDAPVHDVDRRRRDGRAGRLLRRAGVRRAGAPRSGARGDARAGGAHRAARVADDARGRRGARAVHAAGDDRAGLARARARGRRATARCRTWPKMRG